MLRGYTKRWNVCPVPSTNLFRNCVPNDRTMARKSWWFGNLKTRKSRRTRNYRNKYLTSEKRGVDSYCMQKQVAVGVGPGRPVSKYLQDI
jgi:hypothetical protein